MTRIYKLLSSYSFLGLIRYLRMRCMGRELLVIGSCRSCGNCCRKINLEGQGGWLRSEDDFFAVLKDYPGMNVLRLPAGINRDFYSFPAPGSQRLDFVVIMKTGCHYVKNFPTKSSISAVAHCLPDAAILFVKYVLSANIWRKK